MGGPCIGIIPPCIEEFKHPGGKTGVVISGRELHQQDLQVIQARLHNRHRWCGGTWSEIKCLGKLAPRSRSEVSALECFSCPGD